MPKNNRRTTNQHITCYNCGLKGHTTRTCKTDALEQTMRKITGKNKAPEYKDIKQLANILSKTAHQTDPESLTHDHQPLYIKYWNKNDFKKIQRTLLFNDHNIDFNSFRRLGWIKKKWYNDTIINEYFRLISLRNDKIFTLNTNFMSKALTSKDLTIHHCTKKVDIFFFNMVLAPIHINDNHWALILMHNETKTVHFFNPTRETGYVYLSAMRSFLKTEMTLKKGKDLLAEDNWIFSERQDSPYLNIKENNTDSGVLLCQTANLVSTGKNPYYETAAEDLINLRKNITYELLFQKITN